MKRSKKAFNLEAGYFSIPKYVGDELNFLSIRNKVVKKRINRSIYRLFEISPYINDEIRFIKNKVEEFRRQGKVVGIICMTGDLAHPGHIAYVKTAREKIKDFFKKKEGKNLEDKDIVIIIGLEKQSRTLARKGKLPILSDEERKYQWQHIKGVDDVYLRYVPLEYNPSDLMLFIKPDFWISHEEYFDIEKYLKVARKLKYGTGGVTKVIIVRNDDPEKYLPEGDVRKKRNLSTTTLALRILEKQLPSLLKKFPDKVLGILRNFKNSSLTFRGDNNDS